jgi:hypothetical protein
VKGAYLGETRGRSAAVYRPGAGWSDVSHHSRVARRRVSVSRQKPVFVRPLDMVESRRSGWGTRVFIVMCLLVIAAVLTIVLSGGARL